MDGIPQMTAGAKVEHDLIALNVSSGLRTKLRGSPRRPFMAEIYEDVPFPPRPRLVLDR